MGKELYKNREKKSSDYASKEACRTCPNRCTDSKKNKRVRIGYNNVYVPVIMYGAGYFLCKGKEKVTAEYALSCLSCDIRRAANLCGGISELIRRYKGIGMLSYPKIG